MLAPLNTLFPELPILLIVFEVNYTLVTTQVGHALPIKYVPFKSIGPSTAGRVDV